MSGKFVRASKYRHVFGQAAKKELAYENLKITKNAWDSNIISSNGKYLSVNWDASGGGAFAVIPLNEVGKAPDTVPLFRGHKGPVLDTVFNPFNPQQVVSASDDGKILIWNIPSDYSFHKYVDENDNIKDITEPAKILSGHTRKVGHVEFHPCAENVLASCSLDYSVKIWNIETGKAEITLQHSDLVTSFAFNYNGSLLATTSRDKKLRIWDIRSGKVLSEGTGHTGAKPSRVVWLGNTDRVVTTGFSRLSDRQVGIWDIKNIENGPIGGFLVIDASSGVLIPWFDLSTSILYLAGKGDGNIRYYEYDNDDLYELSQYSSVEAQRGFAAVPKHSVNVKENEVLKAFKTVNDSSIEPISFIVPRRSELFQSDIYPDAPSDKPAISAEDWFAGKDVNGPLLLSMEAIYDGTTPSVRESEPVTNVSEVKEAEKKKAEEKKPEPKPVETKPVAKEVKESSPANVDEVLKTSSKVNNLLDKVNDQSDDEDTPGLDDKDGDWEEVTKPESKDGKASPAPEPVKVEKIEPVKEVKVEKKEDPVKIEPKKEEPKKEEPKEVVQPKEVPAVKEATPKAEKLTPEPESKVAASPTKTAGAPTLKATVEKLAGLVSQLESQVSKLTEAGLEKDEKLESLEKKIDELLNKKL